MIAIMKYNGAGLMVGLIHILDGLSMLSICMGRWTTDWPCPSYSNAM